MEKNVKLLKALADRSRIQIIQLLLGGEQCACSLVPYEGRAQPTVSRHLKILEEAGVIQSRRDGINILYRIKNRKAAQVLSVLGIKKAKTNVRC